MRDTNEHTEDGSHGGPDVATLLERVRETICQDPPRPAEALAAIAALAPRVAEVSATEAVDLLERAATFGPVAVVDAVWDAFDGDFAYTGWALALALRCANEDVARDLMARGVDILGDYRKPRKVRALMPHEGTFTRFDLTRESPTLFLNNMDHTVCTEVFEPFTGMEQLAGRPFSRKLDMARTCACVLSIASDGLFDATAFDDVFRAAMVRAWHALRHPSSRDPKLADVCFGLGRSLLELHRTRGMGDGNIELVLGNLIVPRADEDVVAFVCDVAPEVFLGRLSMLDWLRQDVGLVRRMVPHLRPGTPAQNAPLLKIMAEQGFMAELEVVAGWPGALDPESARAAMEAASAAGHAEAATWLLARVQGVEKDAAPRAVHLASGPGDMPVAAQSRHVPAEMPQPAPVPDAAQGAPEPVPVAPVPTPAPDADPHADERVALARQVLDLARGLIVADNPFLASAFAHLDAAPQETTAPSGLPLATNGRVVTFDARAIVGDFARTRKAPMHDLMHVLVHCMMLHPFVSSTVDAACWDLAADAVAEAVTAEVLGPREGDRGRHTQAVIDQMESTLGRRITAERLYHALRAGSFANAREDWARLLAVDDHAAWHPAPTPEGAQSQAGGDSQGDSGNGSPNASNQPGGQPQGPGEPTPQPTGEKDAPHQAADSPVTSDDAGASASDGPLPQEAAAAEDAASFSPKRSAAQAAQAAQSAREGASQSQAPAQPQAPRLTPTERERAEADWRREAKSVRVNLQTLMRGRGSKLGRLVGELEVSTHEQVDYRDFLRQFAVQSEELRLSDDEFDYVFYTYGLSLYGDMPLIEPLEYRDEKRIRDFVIVIDTSSSVTLDVVQQFVDATFDVLTSESSFSQKVNVHIIQADQRVQSDTKISSLADLDRWRRNIKLVGFGGTDFRPAFTYVNELLAAGEFDDLSGLIYFTDGWGIYPDRMPPYKTTFVFYDEDHRPELVPPWAIQITLHPGEFESMSVY
ncbi:MAG: hypothetical protein DUD33_00625 [Coriobacteriaceae bacterium]|nr:MAG: hypothetical protein DUD33_00625 [Coriobacteriaceae bacterium]